MRPEHGATAYRNGCRCSECKRAMADAAANRRRRLYLERAESLAVDPTGTHRRIRSLVALGWSLAEVSRRAGYDRSHAALILKRTSPLHKSTVQKVAAVYDELSMSLPPTRTKAEKIDASRARNLARRNGWPPPLAWPEGRIDDPNYVPRDYAYRPATSAELAADSRDRFDALVNQGAGLSGVMHEMGRTREALWMWCKREGRLAQYRVLVERSGGSPFANWDQAS